MGAFKTIAEMIKWPSRITSGCTP